MFPLYVNLPIVLIFILAAVANSRQPLIFDTDYGPFIDDVFALGLILNSGDLLHLKYVLTTSDNPSLSAKCVTKHLNLAKRSDIRVGAGTSFPDYSMRGGVCAVPGLIAFTLKDTCGNSTLPHDADGVSAVAKMIMDSGRSDWMYIVVGGQSSVKSLVDLYPAAASKIETLIVMGGNFCGGFQPYPGVDAPTDETNIACDPGAANYVLDTKKVQFKRIFYVPVEVAQPIAGSDYAIFVQAANSGTNPVASATLAFYKAWSAAGRADPANLIYDEALAYNPETESTPQFDPCAVMLAIELLDRERCEDRMTLTSFKDGIHFSVPGEAGMKPFPDQPREGFTFIPNTLGSIQLPKECPFLTPFVFDPKNTTATEAPVSVTLGFTSDEAKTSFYSDMALRMAGKTPKCIKKRPSKEAKKKPSQGKNRLRG